MINPLHIIGLKIDMIDTYIFDYCFLFSVWWWSWERTGPVMGHFMHMLAWQPESDSQLPVYASWCNDKSWSAAICKYQVIIYTIYWSIILRVIPMKYFQMFLKYQHRFRKFASYALSIGVLHDLKWQTVQLVFRMKMLENTQNCVLLGLHCHLIRSTKTDFAYIA